MQRVVHAISFNLFPLVFLFSEFEQACLFCYFSSIWLCRYVYYCAYIYWSMMINALKKQKQHFIEGQRDSIIWASVFHAHLEVWRKQELKEFSNPALLEGEEHETPFPFCISSGHKKHALWITVLICSSLDH